MDVIFNPPTSKLRIAVSLPLPIPFTATSTLRKPKSYAFLAAVSDATPAAYGVDFFVPL